jgi:DNA-binding response OmpR family regulator
MTTFHRRGTFSSFGQERFLQRGSFLVDLEREKLSFNNKPIRLPSCVFNYFVSLLRNSPNPVSYSQMVLDSQGYPLPRLESQDLVRVKIYLLRKAIEENHLNPRYILAEPGYGYKLLAS